MEHEVSLSKDVQNDTVMFMFLKNMLMNNQIRAARFTIYFIPRGPIVQVTKNVYR